MKSPVFRPRNTERARQLRAALSPAERRLWSYLSRRQLDGHHFTKQFQIGRYYADFACRKQRLVVELDGPSHDMRQKEDAARDGAMQDEGYRVLRFRNEDVMENAEGVLGMIRVALDHQPSPGPSRTREGSIWA
jgi:very-short-patch-repair endonuclease